jgi:hypothetical protein
VNQDIKQLDYQVNYVKCGMIMTKLYKILDYDNTVVRIFGYKDEAEKFSKLDKCFKIETIKVFKEQKKDNKFIWAYKILGDGIV